MYNIFMSKNKTAKQMERHLKGVANHYRIEILLTVAENEGVTLLEVIEKLKANEKTIGEHARRLFNAGLLDKKRSGVFVELYLSPYGKMFVQFLKSFKNF